MSFLDPITAAGPATELVTTGSPVNVGSSPPPNPGDVLKAVDATHATWQPGGGGGSGGDASGLETTGAPVDVAGSAPPVQGQVLMAVDAEHAEWRVPGLHYDPSIKFWTSSIGSATIAPGTWGFVEQAVGAVDPIVVYIVSSLEAPPVDSRFGLYVGRDVTVPVTVQVVGASQIQGIDGVLGPTTELLPGADYEWVFYHEDSAALWGVVSDTAAVAKRLRMSDGSLVDVTGSAPPNPGDVLTAVDAEHAEWAPPSGGSGSDVVDVLATGIENAYYVLLAADTEIDVSTATVVDGMPVADQLVLLTAQSDPTKNRIWVVSPSGEWNISGTQPAIGQFVQVVDGDSLAGSTWVHTDTDEYRCINVPTPVYAGDGLIKTGATLSLAAGEGESLVFAPGSTSPDIGEWVLAANNTDVSLPVPDAEGLRVGVLMRTTTDGVNAVSTAYIRLNRTVANSHQLRPGGWYEWTSIDHGEGDIRWEPHGGQGDEAKPALEYGGAATEVPALPNQWILATNGDVANAPANPIHGDCFGVYVNGASASVIPAPGQSIVSPDGTLTVGSPSALTLPGSTYYEWIWIASASHWRPKNYLDSPGAGLIRTGKVVSVGANADGSIVVNADDVRVGVLATDAQHGNRGGGALHAAATTSAAGFLSAADKSKLDATIDQTSIDALLWKAPVRVAPTTNITQSGLLTIHSVSLVAGDRVLCAGQTTASLNGIWIVSSGAWTRATDADVSSEMKAGHLVACTDGSYAECVFMLLTNDPIVLGTTGLAYVIVAAPIATVPPSAIAVSGSTGVATKWAREDHTHAHGAQTDGTLHAAATTSVAGFISAADKTKLNNLDLDISINTFRLSNQSGGSGMSNDNAAANTVYLNQYNGNRIALYTGLTWVIVTPGSAMSAAINTATGGAAAGVPIDAFCQYGSATSATLSLVSWTNATTRAFPLAQQDGVWVRASQLSQRYVGTVLPTGTLQFAHVTEASGSSSPVCGIWNRYNRILGAFTWTPTFDSWTIPSADTWQSINAQASAKIQLVQGQAIDAISAEHIAAVNSGTSSACVGIGLDSTTAPTGLRDMSSLNGSIVPVRASLQQLAAAGVHNLNALAIATTTTATFYGAHGNMQGGLTAELWY